MLEQVVLVETGPRACRYLELPGWGNGVNCQTGQPHVGKGDFFLSHSWDSPWTKLVDALAEHTNRFERENPEGTPLPYYW